MQLTANEREWQMTNRNVYEDEKCAAAYAAMEFPGTYYLVQRELPRLIEHHVAGRTAIDFGCGAGRSTRFLQNLGFRTVGVDISEAMLAIARARDPQGKYELICDGAFTADGADLILAAFPFDNIPTLERKTTILRDLAARLAPGGRMINVVSNPEIYLHEWASFSTRDYPENAQAKSGDPVLIVNTDTDDARPVEDIVCTDADYRAIYATAGWRIIEVQRPLGRPEDPVAWVSEEAIAPWAFHVIERVDAGEALPR